MAEKTTIARPYANAAFATAHEQGTLARWSEYLQTAAVAAADPALNRLIGNPRVSSEQLTTLFLDICGAKGPDGAANFIRLLAENDRLDLLPEIAVLFERMRADAEGMIEAEVVSAQPISEQQVQLLANALKARLGREVHLKSSTDETLLGGAVIRAGDLVIDGSAAGKLKNLANALTR